MTTDIATRSLAERFQHLATLIASQRFLQKQGLGNEIPFFICPYDPKEAVAMEQTVKQLVRKLEQGGLQILVINLYDLAIDLLRKREIWEAALQTEETVSKAVFMEFLQSVLDSEMHLVPAIAERMQQRKFDVLFITGVGEVFPYLRSHNILNNLQSTAKERPTVMFFPGEYRHSLEHGASLDLFGRLHDDKYYRAFNIYHVSAW